MKIRSSPSASACCFTRDEPGETRPGTLALRPESTCGSRAQILDAAVGARADEDAVDADLGELLARAEDPYRPARHGFGPPCPDPRSAPGPAPPSLIGSASSGLTPQVTTGAISDASSTISRSKLRILVASRSRSQSSAARSKSSPAGAKGRPSQISRSSSRRGRPCRSARRLRSRDCIG